MEANLNQPLLEDDYYSEYTVSSGNNRSIGLAPREKNEIFMMAFIQFLHVILYYNLFINEELSKNDKEATNFKNDCTIFIQRWIYLFIQLMTVRACCTLLRIIIYERLYSKLLVYDILKTFLVDGCILLWLIVGNIFFYGDENTCYRQ